MNKIILLILDYLKYPKLSEQQPKYIWRENPYSSVIVVTDKNCNIIMKYCMVNNQYMYENISGVLKIDPEMLIHEIKKS